jgi:neutral ceramidase
MWVAANRGRQVAFEAAVSEVDITPVHPPYPSLWMGGYGWGPRGNHGAIARRLRAQCLVIWDDGVPKVLLRADLISVPRDVHQFIRGTLVDEGLVARDDFLLVASHTHSGALYGDIRPDPYIMMNLNQADIDAVNGTTWLITDALVQLVRDTIDLERSEVTLSYAEGEANIGYNRVGLATVLDTVPVLRVDTTGGDLFAVVFGAACHPVSRGKDEVFDGEFPAVASELIENQLGVPALFIQGACGDQEAHDPHIPATTENLGTILGQEVVNVIGNGGFDEVTGPVQTTMTEIDLPFQVDTADPDVQEMLRDKYEARRNALNPLDANWRHADVMIKLIDDGELPTSMAMPIQRWRFGGLSVIALAHEPLSAYHVNLRDAFAGNLWVMGYANECEGYVADNDTLRSGGNLHDGYEAGWNEGDDTIAGFGCWTISYAWPVPLKFSEGDTPDPGTTERIVMDACLDLLNT